MRPWRAWQRYCARLRYRLSKGWRVGLLGLGVLLAGCATFKNTPQQEYTLGAYQQCRHSGEHRNIILDHVNPDGSYTYKYWPGSNNQRAFTECMAQYRRDNPYRQWLDQQKVEAAR